MEVQMISVRDLMDGYVDNGESGIVGYVVQSLYGRIFARVDGKKEYARIMNHNSINPLAGGAN